MTTQHVTFVDDKRHCPRCDESRTVLYQWQGRGGALVYQCRTCGTEFKAERKK